MARSPQKAAVAPPGPPPVVRRYTRSVEGTLATEAGLTLTHTTVDRLAQTAVSDKEESRVPEPGLGADTSPVHAARR